VNPDTYSYGTNVFVAAVQWLEGTLLGTVATGVAVIGVAGVGFLLISGHIDVRRAGQVIFGCFILFGATTIASGIVRVVPPNGAPPEVGNVPPPILNVHTTAKAWPDMPYDPYAGAALPARP
jgi:hypothetical protein